MIEKMVDLDKEVPERIVQERRRIRSERMTLVKDALLLSVIAIALTAFLLVWKAEITGMVVADPQDHYCEGYGEFKFLTEDNIVMSKWTGYQHQLKMMCLPGGVKFHDNSEYVRVYESGLVTLTDKADIPGYYEAFIIAERDSGEFIGKKFRFEVR